MDEREIEQIKEDFELLCESVLGILIYGSKATGEETERSDTDVCVVAPGKEREIYRETLSLPYDVRIFELMPLYLQIEVIEHHILLCTTDRYELYEYFYSFRKRWKDQAQRQKLTTKEALELFK